MANNPHDIDGKFVSGHTWCPPGYIPLKLNDPKARDLLFLYALRMENKDSEFSESLKKYLNVSREAAELMNTVWQVYAERIRQVAEEGWSAEHDDQHDDGSLATAAAAYALSSVEYDKPDGPLCSGHRDRILDEVWPVSWSQEWFNPKNPMRDLVRAGALILAEIGRRLRAGERST